MAYYKIINGIRYDRSLLDAADAYTQGRGEARISLDEIKSIYAIATDAKTITDIEWHTLQYISQNYPLTAPAISWLQERADGPRRLSDIEALITRIARKEFGLKGLQWQISSDEANRQHQNILNIVDFPGALRNALHAFMEPGFSPLSLEAMVGLQIPGDSTAEKIRQSVLEYINDGGILFLVPENKDDQEKMDFDLPDFVNPDAVWHFGLHIPKLSPVLFMARVARDNPAPGYHFGYISRRQAMPDLIFLVVRQLCLFNRLQWKIEESEVNRQLQLKPKLNFGKALFAALRIGIFNGESSFSLRNFVSQDIWQDPHKEVAFYIRQYVESGTLHLLSPQGNPDFPLPVTFAPDFDEQWVFGLEMPQKTQARYVLTTNRQGDYDFSRNDGFLPEGQTLEQQIQQVLVQEFDLPTLEWIVPKEEYEAQRTTFGPDYRSFSSLLRQALNTILHDYLEARSVFNTVAKMHVQEVPQENYASVEEYRTAIKSLIFQYLKTGSLEFLPIELPDNNPVDGEPIEKYWQFFGYLPDLHKVGFWVIIPRYPQDGELPYCYGFD